MTEQEYYEKMKAEYEASTDVKLVEWARPYFEGIKKPNSKDKYIICPVSERAADDIAALTNSDVRGFNHVLRCDEVAHIRNRHGKKGNADSSMHDINDLGRMSYVLTNYDEIIWGGKLSDAFRNSKSKHALSVLFVKRINGHVYIAEAVTDSKSKNALYLESMYKARTSIYLTQKRESVVDDKTPRPNVQNASDSTSTSILPQIEKNVNIPNKNIPNNKLNPPSFREIAEHYKGYKPQTKTRSNANNDGKNSPNRGNSGR